MQKAIKLILFVFLINPVTINAQTHRDSLTSQIIYNFPKDDNTYQKLKIDIKSLEKLEEKPNPEILHSKLSSIYKFNDIDYFKEVLTLLTRKYGYNLSYASGYENYYDSIIQGDLAVWFKEMYIKNHSEWLSENLDKQIDIYRLNSLHENDQLVHKAILGIQNIKGLNHDQIQELKRIDGTYFDKNLNTLLEISNKIKKLPTGNSFALIQNHYAIVETHAMQHQNTFEKAWQGLLPFYKISCLNKNTSSINLRNIDSWMYKYNGKQLFNLIKIEDVPESWRNNPDDKEIPLADPEQIKKLRQELGWIK